MTTPPLATNLKKAKFSAQDLLAGEIYSVSERKYLLSESMLETMISGHTSIFSIFLGVFIGAAGVLWGFWSQTTTEPARRYYLDWAFMSTALAILCLAVCVGSWVKAHKAKRKLKEEAKLLPF